MDKMCITQRLRHVVNFISLKKIKAATNKPAHKIFAALNFSSTAVNNKLLLTSQVLITAHIEDKTLSAKLGLSKYLQSQTSFFKK